MVIRLMTGNDYEAVHALWLSIAGMGLNNLDDSQEGIDRFLKRNPTTCFVAEADKQVVGVIIVGQDGRRGYIYHMAVKEQARKQGIGTRLLSEAMTALKDEGISKVALVVFEKNDIGNHFWEKQGFSRRNDLVYRNKALVELVRIDT